MEKGRFLPLTDLESHNRSAIEEIVAEINQQTKDWETFYTQAVVFHKKNAASWANQAIGKNLESQIDPDFSLVDAVKSM
jgi:CO dehydrogenase maturation factor